MRILIAGAAGNLGSHVVAHLLDSTHHLRLLIHQTPAPSALLSHPNVSMVQADLAQPKTLAGACNDIDGIVYLAGVLFAPLPGRFLPTTNVEYVRNLLGAARACGVRRFILVSFPHVEGETTPEHPAMGRLDAKPEVIHFRTRLEAERLLCQFCRDGGMTPIVFRAGIVYGAGIKLFEAARWMLEHRVMAIWNKPTWAHLIALPDFLAALKVPIECDGVEGIYQVCDDAPLALQELLDLLASHYQCPRPWRLPEWMFQIAGIGCESAALVLRTPALLSRDIVRAGMTSSVADTSRMKRELLSVLAYPTITEGIGLL